MRVDFVAAGDLLNWPPNATPKAARSHSRNSTRLVALMFGAMGINETARVQLRDIV